MKSRLLQMSQTRVILLASFVFTIFYNYTFFNNVLDVYNIYDYLEFTISLGVILFLFTSLIFSLILNKYTMKPLLIIIFIVSSFTTYFMNTYSVVIGDDMIRNMLQTNLNESLDLLTLKQIIYVLFLGVVPSVIIYKIKIASYSFVKSITRRVVLILGLLIAIIAILFIFSKTYTSFFREHKPLRYYTNPTYWIYSIGKYVDKTFNSSSIIVKKIAEDAKIVEENEGKKELIIFVVGEAARADRFSLNGYERETNILLKKENILSFKNAYSCGTSTAHSLPCMFSVFTRDEYSYKKGKSTQNILDVILKSGETAVLWRDNNSESKGVALRVDYENFKTKKLNTMCDNECRDEGMLIGLDKYIEKNKHKDILIILHQMGSHGPAYYKRYPKEFEKFTPTCKTNQLEKCTRQEINNAYDNSIVYTDYFLSKTINFLKNYSKTNDVGMIYMSDHGESLGKNGIYLHGMPYFMAPKAQKHIPAIMWLEKLDDINHTKALKQQDKYLTHDNIFSTLLGLFEIKTSTYNPSLDIFKDSRK